MVKLLRKRLRHRSACGQIDRRLQSSAEGFRIRFKADVNVMISCAPIALNNRISKHNRIRSHEGSALNPPHQGRWCSTTDCNTRARAATIHLRPVHGDTALLNPHETQRVQSGPQHESQRATAHDDPIFHERYVRVCARGRARASPRWRQLTCPVHSLDDAVLQFNE